MPYDLLLRNVRLVRPGVDEPVSTDIGIIDGRCADISPGLPVDGTLTIVDGRGRLAFPGLVDAHMHVGIYHPLEDDAQTESRAAAMGGVTSSLNYMRTGQYYLNKGGAYRDFFPEVLARSAGRF